MARGFGIILLLACAILYYLIYIRPTNSGLTFTNPLPIPVLLEPTQKDGQKVFDLVVQHGQTEFLAGQKAETMGYNGNYLGPTIRVNQDDEFVINVTSEL